MTASIRSLAFARVPEFVHMFGGTSFLLPTETIQQLQTSLCSSASSVCRTAASLAFGGIRTLNDSRWDRIAGYSPSGTSVKNMIQWGQSYRRGIPARFDYGALRNRIYYQSDRPPTYNLTDLPKELRLAIFYGAEDTLVTQSDVDVFDVIKPQIIFQKRIDLYAHLDFVWSFDAKDLVYMDLVQLATTAADIPPVAVAA